MRSIGKYQTSFFCNISIAIQKVDLFIGKLSYVTKSETCFNVIDGLFTAVPQI